MNINTTEELKNSIERGADCVVLYNIQLLLERTLIEGSRVDALFDEHIQLQNSQEGGFFEMNWDTSDNIKIKFRRGSSDVLQHRAENFIFNVDRVLSWCAAARKRNLLSTSSPLKQVLKRWQKDVSTLRDYLMHMEEYVVAGRGRKPKGYIDGVGALVAGTPNSSVVLVNCTIEGKTVPKVYLIGARLDFFSIFKDMEFLYLELRKAGLFRNEAEGHFELSINSEQKK